jgi:hypothetical protein
VVVLNPQADAACALIHYRKSKGPDHIHRYEKVFGRVAFYY